jgi:hypothetical protein
VTANNSAVPDTNLGKNWGIFESFLEQGIGEILTIIFHTDWASLILESSFDMVIFPLLYLSEHLLYFFGAFTLSFGFCFGAMTSFGAFTLSFGAFTLSFGAITLSFGFCFGAITFGPAVIKSGLGFRVLVVAKQRFWYAKPRRSDAIRFR